MQNSTLIQVKFRCIGLRKGGRSPIDNRRARRRREQGDASSPTSVLFSSTVKVNTTFGQTAPAQSPFGQTTVPGPSPFGQNPATPAPAPGAAAAKFGGRNPRDLLREFYQANNPTKVNEIDKVLAKYAGNEEQLFVNLAKKYNKDPSIFGIATQAQPNATPTFGSPAPLGGGGGFGAASTFGGAPTCSAEASRLAANASLAQDVDKTLD